MSRYTVRPTVLLSFIALLLAAPDCHQTGSGTGPSVFLTLNAIPDDQNDLLVVPPSGFLVTASWSEGAAPVDPESLVVVIERWGVEDSTVEITSAMVADAQGAIGVVPGWAGLVPGTHTVLLAVSDVQGRVTVAELDFAVRNFLSGPPIDPINHVFFDFEADRDATPGPDFEVDLQAVGLGSAAEPALSDVVVQRVRTALVGRVLQAYWSLDPNGIGFDPVPVIVTDTDPGATPLTRICVGGEDPSGGVTLGAILIDPNNANPGNVECGTLPPTGIFPREILVWQGNSFFQETFDPFMPSRGGVPVGLHPADAVILAPGFDPGTATPEELARHEDLSLAIERYGNAIGSVMAHELGHALGLVQPGPPGGGCFGGTGGAAFSHSVEPGGATPTPNFLMKAGGTFNFPKLAGLGSNPLPYFRNIEHAYLRNRIVQDSRVTALLMPPVPGVVTPLSLSVSLPPSSTVVTVTGSGFQAGAELVLASSNWTYYAIGESVGGGGTSLTATVIDGQLLPGTYAVEIHNPDGQVGVGTLPLLVLP